MNENYYIGIQAFKDGLGVSHSMNTVTEHDDISFNAWFAGYNDAWFEDYYDKNHRKPLNWWIGK